MTTLRHHKWILQIAGDGLSYDHPMNHFVKMFHPQCVQIGNKNMRIGNFSPLARFRKICASVNWKHKHCPQFIGVNICEKSSNKNGKMATVFWFPPVWFMTSSRKNPSILYIPPRIFQRKKWGHRQPWFDCLILIYLEVSYLTITALDMAPVCTRSLPFYLNKRKTWHEKQHRLGSSMGWF